MFEKKVYFFILILSIIFILFINIDINCIVYALSFEYVDEKKLNLNSYNNAIVIVKNSILPGYLRTEENILLENQIYNMFDQEQYELILKKRVLFMSEYIKHQQWYYKYITTDIYKQSNSPLERAKLVNTLMHEFYINWQKEYNVFLKKIILREI